MKILVVADGIWPPSVQLTGMKAVYQLQKYLAKKGVEIHILTFIENWANAENWRKWFKLEEERTAIHFHPFYSSTLISLPIPLMWKPFLFLKIFQLNSKYHFDIIHEYLAFSLWLQKTIVYRIFFKGPIISTITTYTTGFLGSCGFFETLKFTDVIICTSRDMWRTLKVYPDIKKIYLPLGVDFKQFDSNKHRRTEIGIPLNNFIILYIGPLEKSKGIFTLAEAVPRIARKYPNTTFLIATTPRAGPAIIHRSSWNFLLHNKNKKKILEIVKEHKQKLHFLEGVQSIPHLMSIADVFVYPLLVPYGTLSYPLTLLEAMASGKAIVASNLTGITELILNGKNGFLFTAGNSIELANAVNKLLSDGKMRKKLGEDAKRTARRYDIHFTASKLLNIYREILVNSE